MTAPRDGRDAVLARLAAAPAAPYAPRSLPMPPPPAAAFEADSVQALGQALERLGASWEATESAVVARLTLVTRLQDEGVKQVLAWHASQLPLGGVLESLDVLGIEVITPTLHLPDVRLRPQDLEVRRKQLLALDSVTLGLTGADLACAATGALLLNSGPGRPLLVSQLPRRHVVLLPASHIIPNLNAWFTAQSAPAALATWIAGPSRTLDIEATAAYGLHGPGKLHVIVIQGL